MLELTIIQTRGFRNCEPGNGFEIRLRLPAYRSLWTSLLDGATITVDGERFAPETIGWVLDGRAYSLRELQDAATCRRWRWIGGRAGGGKSCWACWMRSTPR